VATPKGGALGLFRLVGSTHVVVHQCVANSAGGADNHVVGKTSGGRHTKIMALTDGRGHAMNLPIIAGQAYEGHRVLPLGNSAGLCVVGDKGFESDKVR